MSNVQDIIKEYRRKEQRTIIANKHKHNIMCIVIGYNSGLYSAEEAERLKKEETKNYYIKIHKLYEKD